MLELLLDMGFLDLPELFYSGGGRLDLGRHHGRLSLVAEEETDDAICEQVKDVEVWHFRQTPEVVPEAVEGLDFKQQMQVVDIIEPEEVGLEGPVVIQLQHAYLPTITQRIVIVGGVECDNNGLHGSGGIRLDRRDEPLERIDGVVVGRLIVLKHPVYNKNNNRW